MYFWLGCELRRIFLGKIFEILMYMLILIIKEGGGMSLRGSKGVWLEGVKGKEGWKNIIVF